MERTVVRSGVALALLLAPGLALAQDGFARPDRARDREPEPEPVATAGEPAPSALEDASEIVVTATRRAASDFDVPYSTATIGRDGPGGIETRLRRTVTDALVDLPSVLVQKTAYGQSSPFLRGFTGYQTVMLVDGIRLNNSTFRSGPNQYWATIDPFSVERIEVVRGAGSVLYGSDAVGGVANAVARRASRFADADGIGGRTFARWSDAESSWTLRGEVEGRQGDVGFLAGSTYRSYGDLEAGSGTRTQPGTGYRDTDGDLRLDWRQNDDVAWAFGVQHVDQDGVPRTHKTVDAVPFRGTTVGTELKRELDQTRDLLYLRWSASTDWPVADRAEVTTSWHEQRERQHRIRDTSREDFQGTDVATLGVQAQLEKRTDLGDVTYGVEWWRDDVDSFRRDYRDGALDLVRIQGPVADDARYDLVGVFAQDEIAWGATTFTAGARWTYAKLRAGEVDDPTVGGADPATPGNVMRLSDSWSDVVGSLRAVHTFDPDWNVFGGVSQAFRAPNLSDLTMLDDTSGVETPSPGLDSEDYVTYEAGLRGRGERWSGRVAYWTTDIDGMIVPSPTGRLIGGTPEVRKDNVGDGHVHGIEVEARYRLTDDITLDGAFSWMDGEVDQIDPKRGVVREPLSRLMPTTLVGTVTYAPQPGSWSVWGSVRHAEDQDDLSLKDATDTERIPPGGTPGYTVLSLGGRLRLCENADLIVALENVTNRNHRIHGSGVNEPGRNLVLALDVRF